MRLSCLTYYIFNTDKSELKKAPPVKKLFSRSAGVGCYLRLRHPDG